MKTLCIVLLALGDLIFLKDGRTIEGVYVGEDGEFVQYRVASGKVLSEPKSSIARVQRVCTKTNVYEAVASTLTAERPAEYFYLCAWAEEQGLKPPAENLCRVAVSDEEIKGTVLLRLSKAAAGEEARSLQRSAAVASPELTGAVAALRSVPERKTELPREFLSAFTRALDSAAAGSYASAAAKGRHALSLLDPAQRREVDATFERRMKLKADAFLSRLEALAKEARGGETCRYCHGTGFLSCLECNARGWKTCPNCQGKGYRKKVVVIGASRQDQLRECGACRGSGRVNCRTCIILDTPLREDVFINLPRALEKHDRMPRARNARTWQYERTKTTADGGTSYTSTSMSTRGALVPFEQRRSGKRRCPHCAKKKKGRVKRFTASELAELGKLARLWEGALKSPGGGWTAKVRLRGLGKLYAELRFEPEQATAFYRGRWMTPRAQRMHLSAGRRPSAQADTSAFEEWKTGYKLRMVSERAVGVPAEPGAWLGLFKLYLRTAKTDLTRRFASRQVYCASFSSRAREASFLSPRGEFLGVAGKAGLVLQPDRALDTGGAGRVELWFRVLNAAEDPRRVLAVQVLAARWDGKTVVFF